ncbi:metacaspase-1 [Aplysia californica]|uniref:Metacaspase-1 n=1 Tax=Aplysia californica TaxID=6500 RepID=A0ABM0JVZ2_APLCA|nr:metacaspase-1 [Aplysia californica]
MWDGGGGGAGYPQGYPPGYSQGYPQGYPPPGYGGSPAAQDYYYHQSGDYQVQAFGYFEEAPKSPMVQYEQARMRDTDERDAVQKKTFTKWVNKHLLKVGVNTA